MGEMDRYIEKLESLAPKMRALRPGRRAKLRYHALAGAVYWSDEIPADLDADEEDTIRILLRYRTTCVLGGAEELWRDLWEAAKRTFPDWIGFSRVSQNPVVVAFYRAKDAKLQKDIRRAMEQ